MVNVQMAPDKGRRNFYKCEACRSRKKKCLPEQRVWPGQKCKSCAKKNLPCGPNKRVKGSSVQSPIGGNDYPKEDSQSNLPASSAQSPDNLHALERWADDPRYAPANCLSDDNENAAQRNVGNLVDESIGFWANLRGMEDTNELLEECDFLDRNPLHIAVEQSDLAAIETLTHLDSSLVEGRDELGRTPFLLAARLGSLGCLRKVLECPAPNSRFILYQRDREMQSALAIAAGAGAADVVEHLLALGMPPDDEHSPTPALHVAAKNNSRQVCELLLVNGASPNFPDFREKKLPSVHAYENGHDDLARFLSQQENTSMGLTAHDLAASWSYS